MFTLELKKICGNCRFRGEEMIVGEYDGDDNGKPSGFFRCELIKHHKVAGLGGWPAMPTERGAVVVDGSGYHAALCVESDFACNKWEPAT